MAKMNPKIKKLWVHALRSGVYKQGKYVLRTEDNKFCCLGVLCNIHAKLHPKIAAEQTDPTKYMGRMSFPPPEVLQWAGLHSFDPGVTLPNGVFRTLAELNDGAGVRKHSFKRIAKLIEEQL